MPVCNIFWLIKGELLRVIPCGIEASGIEAFGIGDSAIVVNSSKFKLTKSLKSLASKEASVMAGPQEDLSRGEISSE